MESYFFNRDISWLSFNGRVLEEAAAEDVPLLERINFLAIFSSNLDEFFRVRMPVLKALNKLGGSAETENTGSAYELLEQAKDIIDRQQQRFGHILTKDILPALKENGVHLIYNEAVPEVIEEEVREYFLSHVLAFLHPVVITGLEGEFFPENNSLYTLLTMTDDGSEKNVVLNIPSDQLPRFYRKKGSDGIFYIVFLDDIIKYNASLLFRDAVITGSFNFKVTRNAEIDLADEYSGDLLEQISRQITKRKWGLATRFLYQPGINEEQVKLIKRTLNLKYAQMMQGGTYHNLNDFRDLPYKNPDLSYRKWLPLAKKNVGTAEPLCVQADERDLLFHPPYDSYNSILRFFNEAATNEDVSEIYVTVYRVASNSRIINALITAAQNGKKVTVMVELKARFDEANNIKWARKMKAAGIKLVYSITALKVHAKIALVKRKAGMRMKYTGLLATGNFNESTAAFYTDHVLMTSNKDILREMEMLFIFLSMRERPRQPDMIPFKHLLVSQFNLLQRFLGLIDREIALARHGKEASLIIKLNNLEERVLINKLYEASQAGVRVQLIVRSVCCLVPGVEGMSERISVIRIVDRYLEHGRVFIFNNGGNTEVFMGSADWMNRNIYRRIEVCFPVTDQDIKKEVIDMVNLQLSDTVKAVKIDSALNNVRIGGGGIPVQSQQAIYNMLSSGQAETRPAIQTKSTNEDAFS